MAVFSFYTCLQVATRLYCRNGLQMGLFVRFIGYYVNIHYIMSVAGRILPQHRYLQPLRGCIVPRTPPYIETRKSGLPQNFVYIFFIIKFFVKFFLFL